MRDPGELPVPGVKVTLYDGDGKTQPGRRQPLMQMAAISSTKLTSGTYSVGFDLPPGFVFTVPDVGGDSSIDSNANRVTGRTGPIVLPPGANELTWDAGVLRQYR